MEQYGFRLLDKLGILPMEFNDLRYAAEYFIDRPEWETVMGRIANGDPEIPPDMCEYLSAVDAEMKKIAPAVKGYKLAYLINELKAVSQKFKHRERRYREKSSALMGIKKLRRERVEIKDLMGEMKPPKMHTEMTDTMQKIYENEAHNMDVMNNWYREEDEAHRAFAAGGDTLVNYLIGHTREI